MITPPVCFDSIDEMLSPARLAGLVGAPVSSVERIPLEVAHFSGNSLERVIVGGATAEQWLVLKRFAIERDWVMRLTHDHAVREVTLYRHGIYAQLPVTCYVPIVAVARDGTSWASLMTDVGAGLPSADGALSLAELQQYLTALAAVHACYMNNTSLDNPALGLSSLRDFVQILAAPTVAAECAAGRTHPVLEAARRGWQLLSQAAPPEAVQLVAALAHDPEPLLAALAHMPQTLIHGDFKPANLGIWSPEPNQHPVEAVPTARTIMLDWQDAAKGPALLDLGYWLAISGPRLPVAPSTAINIYRAALEQQGYYYSDHEWQHDLELCLLAGGALRLLWQKALAAQSAEPAASATHLDELRWWCALVIRACRWLE